MIICKLISYRNYQIKLRLLKRFDDSIGNIFHFNSTLPITITYARLEVVSILGGCNTYNEKYSRLRLSVAKFTSTFANVDLTNTQIDSSIKELPAVIFKKRYKNSIIESYKNHE